MKLLAVILKTARVLYRDRAQLAVLFVMPVALVLVVSVIQEDAFRVVEGNPIQLLVVDQDGGSVVQEMAKALGESGHFRVVQELDGRPLTEETARQALTAGRFQVGLVLRPGTSKAISQSARDLMTEMLSGARPASATEPAELLLCFDPMIRGMDRQSIGAALQSVVLATEMRLVVASAGEMAVAMGRAPTAGAGDRAREIVRVRESYAGQGAAARTPSSIQQNVPAWTLFAMFMVVIPLSSVIIRERNEGTLVRLRTLPVSRWTLMLGNITVYVVLCLVQFVVMLLIGFLLLPKLGTSRLEMGHSLAATALVAVASALAASGFGMLVATLARTHEQASFFGATFTVIAGALGGIMVPVFMMPPRMQSFSHYSPLNWGLNAFHEVFLRGGDVAAVLPDVLRLTGFFLVTLALAVFCFERQFSTPSWMPGRKPTS